MSQQWRSVIALNTLRAEARLELATRISSQCEGHGLHVAIIKGPPLSQRLYGHWATRPAGDLDLYARDGRREVEALLVESGLHLEKVDPSGESTFRAGVGGDACFVEVHSNLLDESTMVFTELRARGFSSTHIGEYDLPILDAPSELVHLGMQLSCDGSLTLLRAFDFALAWRTSSVAHRASATDYATELGLHRYLAWSVDFSGAVTEASLGDLDAIRRIHAARRELQVRRIMRLAVGARAKAQCVLGWIYPRDIRGSARGTLRLARERVLKLARFVIGQRDWRRRQNHHLGRNS